MSISEHAKRSLLAGIAELPLTVDVAALLDYLSVLIKWNRAYNLTAIRDDHHMVTHHLLDSLAMVPYLRGDTVLDVGSGAGLPGIPLAIACPDKTFTLLDSLGKKTRFLLEAKRVLGLTNVTVVQQRVERYQPPHGFTTLVSRAFSDVQTFLTLTTHLRAPHGLWLMMKGQVPHDELAAITGYDYQVLCYAVPQVVGERCCVMIEKD